MHRIRPKLSLSNHVRLSLSMYLSGIICKHFSDFFNYKLSDVNHCHEVCCMLGHLGVIKTDSFDQEDIKQVILNTVC